MPFQRSVMLLALGCAVAWVGAASAEGVVEAGKDNPAYKAELYRPAANAAISPKKPLPLQVGPHLFIDDYLIDKSDNLKRRVNCPQRDPKIPNPIISGDGRSWPCRSDSRR